MKKAAIIVLGAFFILSAASCATANSAKKNETEIAGYTLKNKKELMQQKILNRKKKSVIATP
ncbi:hypothetical protein [Marixanthomonas spongiae]|uniref:Lipoprotein n=1 Tax=Marixanthomonas spongiae TaxID=2174845 RepID=A0A2U0I801_9FLAO|nr:hypothetical protein [Marixanthomonas spongiae]PVW17232.1 hypothetical protein DDV96_01590 [Marixanthomonas spongiae]